MMELNGKEVDRGSLWVEDVDTRDYPDFCDAHFVGACFVDGTPLTDDEVEQLNTKYSDVLWEMALESLH
jgi:hypothetical protein